MKIIIDTSSLIYLVRYYLPVDSHSVLHSFFESKIKNGEIIIIDKVYDECEKTAQGIVTNTMSFLKNKNYHYKTGSILPPTDTSFTQKLNNDFVVGLQKKKLSIMEFDGEKNKYVESADFKQILVAYDHIFTKEETDIFIVTEESKASNDNKLFKKIPAICAQLKIPTMTLPELLKKYKITCSFCIIPS